MLEHPDAAWLPTEDEKVNALTAGGIAKDLLPRRLYQGAVGAQYRYFPHKLPVALDGLRTTFLFVQAEDETESAVRTWAGSTPQRDEADDGPTGTLVVDEDRNIGITDDRDGDGTADLLFDDDDDDDDDDDG